MRLINEYKNCQNKERIYFSDLLNLKGNKDINLIFLFNTNGESLSKNLNN